MTHARPPHDPAPEPDDFACFTVYSANHAFSRVYKPLLKSLGLTYPQYLVMVALWARDERTVGDLCSTLLLESSTVTPLLKRLEALGHIARRRDSRDERVVHIRLTDSGRAMRAKARDFPACVDATTGLSPQKLAKLKQDIRTMRRHLLEAALDNGG